MEDRFADDPTPEGEGVATGAGAAPEEKEGSEDGPGDGGDGVADDQPEGDGSDDADDDDGGAPPEDVDELRKGYMRQDKFTRENQRVKQKQKELDAREAKLAELEKVAQQFQGFLSTLPPEQREAIVTGKPLPVKPAEDSELQEILRTIPPEDVMHGAVPRIVSIARRAEQNAAELKARLDASEKRLSSVGNYLFQADVERQLDRLERIHVAKGTPLSQEQLAGIRQKITSDKSLKLRLNLADSVFDSLYGAGQKSAEKKQELRQAADTRKKIERDMPLPEKGRVPQGELQKSTDQLVKEAAADVRKKWGV